MEGQEHTITPLADLFGNYTLPPSSKKKRTSERSELVRYFYDRAKTGWRGKTELTPARIAYKLSHLTLQDLYAFKSMCMDRERNGYPWSKYFWGSLKNHEWDNPSVGFN